MFQCSEPPFFESEAFSFQQSGTSQHRDRRSLLPQQLNESGYSEYNVQTTVIINYTAQNCKQKPDLAEVSLYAYNETFLNQV